MPWLKLPFLSSRRRRRSRHEIAHVPRDREPRERHREACGEHREETRVLRDGPADGAAEERAEELYARIDSRGRARGLARSGARDERGELGFQNVEPREEDDERGNDAGHIMQLDT